MTALALSMQQLAALRDSIDPDDTNDSYCYDAVETVAQALCDAGQDAHLCDAGAVRDRSHCYVILDADGTIIDPTLDQFYPGGRGNSTGDWTDPVWERRDRQSVGEPLPGRNEWFGQVAVIPADHPFAQHYYSHRADHASDMFPQGYWLAGQEPGWWRRLHARPGA